MHCPGIDDFSRLGDPGPGGWVVGILGDYSPAVVRLGRASGTNCGSESWCESYLAGGLSDVRLWSIARSPAQIAGTRFSRLTGSEAGLVAYWRLDEGSGDIAYDATGRGHDMRLGAVAGPDAADPLWSTTDGPPILP